MNHPQDFRPPPSGAETPIVPWRMDAGWVVVAGLVLWSLGYAGSQITAPATGFPSLFLPAGILVGLLLRIRTVTWVWALGAVMIVSLATGALLTADPWSANVVWAGANVCEAAVVAGALRWWRTDLTRARDPLMIFLAAAVGVGVIAYAGSLILGALGYGDPTVLWADWWGADVLSIVLVAPLFLLVGRAALPRRWAAVEATLWLVLTTGLLAAEFSDQVSGYMPTWMWLVVGTPLVLLYGVRFGLLAMMFFLVVLDFVAVALTAGGSGPFLELALEPGGSALRTLQMMLLLLAVILPSICILIHTGLARGRIVADQQALLDAVIEGSPVPTVVLEGTAPEEVVRANRAYRELAQKPGDSAASLLDLFPAEERPAVVRLLQSVDPADRQEVTAEFPADPDSHGSRLLRVRVVAVSADTFDRSGEVRPRSSTTRVVHVEDITEAREREYRLHRDATTDPLTGLANRRQLLHILHSTLSRVGPGQLLAVAYLDLDGFKEVNDRFGHSAGDQLLREVADCLRRCVRPGDLVARAGGDEFVVVSPGLPDHAAARHQADRIRDGLARCSVSTVASVGLAVTADSAVSPEELLRLAEREMYRAKLAGGDRVADVRTPRHQHDDGAFDPVSWGS